MERLLYILISAFERRHCKNCISWPWPIFPGKMGTFYFSSGKNRLIIIWVDFCRFWYLPSRDNIAKIVFHDLDWRFEGNQFETLISVKPWELARKCIAWHLLILIFAIERRHCKSCTSWFDLLPGQIFKMRISRIRRERAKMLHTAFINFDVWHRTAPFQKL